MPEDSSTFLKTPGVYIAEPTGMPGTVTIATDIPAFVGYTESAVDPVSPKPLTNVAVSIASMADYRACFGGPPAPNFVVTPTRSNQPAFVANVTDPDGSIASRGFDLTMAPSSGGPGNFCLYWQMALYFANGGGACWVVSVGDYSGAIAADALLNGIDAMKKVVGPSMLLVPEACQLEAAGYASVVDAMLAQAAWLQDRVAILDLPGCHDVTDLSALTAAQQQLWAALAPQADNLSYAAAYGPALATTIVQPRDVRFTALAGAGNATINAILTTQAVVSFTGQNLATLQSAIAAAFPVADETANTSALSGDASDYPAPVAPGPDELALWQQRLDNLLISALPIFVEVDQLITDYLNVQPPSGVMAGIWAQNDARVGVWNAPANVAPVAVTAPVCPVTDAQQDGFNVPVNGMAINLIRQFPGRGTLVWGARTLDGNSQDWRYVQVRRTVIYIEQSVKTTLQQYVFAANNATTWTSATNDVAQFLHGLWSAGGLSGASPGDASVVQCGLGSTMTAQDVLDGYLKMTVQIAPTHPAEFIVLTFQQAMPS